MRQILSRLKLTFAAFAFVLTTAMSSGGAVLAATNGGNPAGNNGTLKIHEQGTPIGTENNDPKVCVFNVEGFGLDAEQTGYLMFNVQGGDTPTGTPAGPYSFGPTDAAGYYESQYFNLDPGHYKATLYGKQLPSGNLKDVKAKSKVFKVDCGTQSKEVTPTKPTESTPTCENPNLTVTPPYIEGILWTPTGSTVLKPGESVTYTARADTANGYVLAHNTQTSWTVKNSFDPSSCPQTIEVIPTMPTATEPSCTIRTMIVTPPVIMGIAWTPSGSTTLQLGESVTYIAHATQGHSIASGAQTEWTFTNRFDPSDCNHDCGCIGNVTPGEVKFKDVCGIDNDAFYIPKTSHVKYYVDGSNTAETTGWHDSKGLGAITVVAKADQGYKLSGQSEWSGAFTDLPCKVRPKPVEFRDVCGTENDTFTVPFKKNIEYRVDGHKIAAGEHEGTGTVTVTAVALNGFQVKGQTTWTKTFTDEPCGGGHGGGGVTPGEVTFTDITCESKGSFKIPNTPGVVYKDANGAVLTAGTHQVTTAMTLDVTAFPENDNDTLSGQTTWSHKFKLPVNCETGGGGETTTPPKTTGGGQGGGFVLGESTTLSGGKGAGEVLANTGANTLVTTLLSLMMVGGSLALYAYRPKVEQQ